jgi:hypothetical protein
VFLIFVISDIAPADELRPIVDVISIVKNEITGLPRFSEGGGVDPELGSDQEENAHFRFWR